jgi:hypothetical protein
LYTPVIGFLTPDHLSLAKIDPMAFKPTLNQAYYLIAKHSGKVLGFTDNSRGKSLQQMDYDSTNKQQRFRFEPGSGFFWITTPPYKKNYLAVNNSSLEDAAVVLQWEWEAPKHNSRFLVEPAYNGYYRIKAMHSGKFLDVFEAKKTTGAAVVQHRLMGSDNQLFMLVPAMDEPIETVPQSFRQTTDYVREATLGLAGLIPTVGGGLKVLLGGLWAPEDQLSQLWERMKEYVDMKINAAIEKQAQEDLKDIISGKLEALKEILWPTADSTRASNFDALVQSLVTDQTYFKNKPKERLLYVLGYGTLFIAMRKANAYHYQEFHGVAPAGPVFTQNKEALKETIKSWGEQVALKKKELLDARMALIKDRRDYRETVSKREGTTLAYFSEALDTYDGWKMTWSLNYYRESDNDYKEHAENAVVQRRKQVKVQYETMLDEFIRISRFWKYLNPEEPAYVPVTVSKEVGYFGGPYHHNGFKGVEKSSIQKIVVHSNNGGYVCGIEIFYTSKAVSDGLKGAKGNHTEELMLREGEYITSVHGYMNRFVQGVWFTSQLGNTVGGGVRDATYFSADLADSFNARLVNISGSINNGNTLERLSFHWEYED